MELLKKYFPNHRLEDKLDLNTQQFSAYDMTDFAEYIAHLIVNDAVCSSKKIKGESSNECDEFVDRWFKENNR